MVEREAWEAGNMQFIDTVVREMQQTLSDPTEFDISVFRDELMRFYGYQFVHNLKGLDEIYKSNFTTHYQQHQDPVQAHHVAVGVSTRFAVRQLERAHKAFVEEGEYR